MFTHFIVGNRAPCDPVINQAMTSADVGKPTTSSGYCTGTCTKSICDETLSVRLVTAQIMRHDPRSGEIMATLASPGVLWARIADNDLINVES